MFSSSDCFCGRIPTNPKNVGVLLRKNPDFKMFEAQNRVLCRILNRASSNNGGLCERLYLEAKGLAVKAASKDPSKWNGYGGCIPSILLALETIQDLDEALKPWEGSLNSKERTIILKEQTDWRRALEIFDWFKQKGCHELNVIHYNVMLRLLGRAQRWDLLVTLWSEMQLKRVKPTNSTYGTLIDMFSKGGMKKEALVWLGELYKQGMEPDEVTMAIVLQTYKKAREFQKAEQFFTKWSSEMSDDPLVQKCRSLYACNTLIDTYGKEGKLDKVAETFEKMLRGGICPDTVTFNTMIHACGNHGRLEEVSSLIAMMDEYRCVPDTRTYNILISLYLKCDDIHTAASYFSKMKATGLVPDIVSYRTLLYAYSIRNGIKEAEDLMMEMEDQGVKIDEYTQSALTRMYSNMGLLKKSWSWFERFVDEMSSECFAANIDAFGEHGHLYLAEKAFCSCLEKKKLSVLVFNVMIKAYGIGKKHDKACELFDGMSQYGFLPDKCTYTSLIQILSAAELPQRAAVYLRRMQQEGFVGDCIPYSFVIASFTKLGELQIAEDLLKEMIRFGIQPDIVIYSILINAFAESGNVQEAMNYISSMKKDGLALNSIICNSLIKLYTKIGYLQEAQEVYKLLKSLQDDPDIFSSNCMIDLYCENAMVREAEEIFENLKFNGKANEFSYAMMLCLYKKLGRFDEAYGIAKEMKDLGFLTSTLSCNNVVSLFASEGRMKNAIETFQHMLASGIQLNDATFRALGIILLKHGVSKVAIKHLELMRAEDPQIGLNEWIKALCSILRLDLAGLKHGIKSKSHFVVNPSTKRTTRHDFGAKKKLEVKPGLVARSCRKS